MACAAPASLPSMLDTVNLKDELDDDGSDSDAGEMPVFGRATMKRHSEAIIDQAIQEEIESQDILVVNGKKLDVPAKGTNNRLPTPSRNDPSTEEPDEESDGEEDDEQSFLEAQKKTAKVASQASSAGQAGVAKTPDAAAAVDAGAGPPGKPPRTRGPAAAVEAADAAAAYAAARRAAPASSIGVAASSVPGAGPGVARMTRATPRSAGLQAVPRPTNV